MTKLNDFVKQSLNCSQDKANEFISKFRYYDAVDYGRNILENHREGFTEDFDIDFVTEDTLSNIAIRLEDDCLTDLSVIEDNILKDVFQEKYL